MDSRRDQADSQLYSQQYARETLEHSSPYQRHTSGIRSSGVRENSMYSCLGQETHPMQPGEMICQFCGHLAAGAQLGIYQVQRFLGSGRGGHTYLAIHARSKQQVVLKLFPPDPMSTPLWEEARQEARTAAALNHRSILPVFSCTHWQPNGQQAPGKPLHELITKYSARDQYLLTLCQYTHANLTQFIAYYEKREAQQALKARGISLRNHLVTLIQQIGSALSSAHARNLVHGALLPGNILLDGRDRLWIADFGLARLHPPFEPYLAPELQDVVRRGAQIGHWQDFWRAVTPASDQYMLAQVCELLFTRLLSSEEYEKALPVVRNAAQAQPERRFSSVDAFLHELLPQLRSTSGTAFSTTGASNPMLPQSVKTTSGSNPVHAPLATSASSYASYQRGSSPAQVRATTSDNRYLPSTLPGSAPSSPEIEQYQKMMNYDLAASLPSSPVDEWEKKGDKLFTAHDYAGAVRAYRQALALDNYRSTLWLALGDAHFALEEYKEALSAYEKALQLNPNDAQGWSNRGTVLDVMGRRQEALECYERAEQLEA